LFEPAEALALLALALGFAVFALLGFAAFALLGFAAFALLGFAAFALFALGFAVFALLGFAAFALLALGVDGFALLALAFDGLEVGEPGGCELAGGVLFGGVLPSFGGVALATGVSGFCVGGVPRSAALGSLGSLLLSAAGFWLAALTKPPLLLCECAAFLAPLVRAS
jgi:hypothetical protein